MAASLTASFPAGDMSSDKFRRKLHPHQSIPPLRRERTTIHQELLHNGELKPVYSQELPVRSAAFSGEKQYDRRQASSKARSAKSDEIFRLIDRRLQTGVHGVRLLFRSNDPKQEGKLSKDAFRRVLMQLCGYINNDEWEKICRLFHLNERDNTITFQEFLSYFPDNEKVKRELSAAQTDRRTSELLTLSQNISSSQPSYRSCLPKLTANYCFTLMKAKCRDPSFSPNDYFPTECLNNGVILRDHARQILINFQLDDLLEDEREFEKLWLKFDLANDGMVRSNVFLRLLDYRVNLADEIDANIQKLVTRPGAAGVVDRRISSSATVTGSASRKQRFTEVNKSQDSDDSDKQVKHCVPPPPSVLEAPSHELSLDSTMPFIEDHNENLTKSLSTGNLSTREVSTKFRTLVKQHRKMLKQLHENDEFLPYFDRKVNEGYFSLKTVFSYLDANQTNFITKEQLAAAMNQFDIPISVDNIDAFLHKHHLTTSKSVNNEGVIDYNAFLKYFQDRSESGFLAHALNTLNKEKSTANKTDFHNIEHGLIDLLHHVFLSITAAFKYISNDIDDLCPEKELFIILRKELCIADGYRFTEKQRDEIYNLLNCTGELKHKRLLPYKRLLYYLTKTTIPLHKERNAENKEERVVEKKPERVIERRPDRIVEENEDDHTLPKIRKLSYIEKILNDLIRLRMHTFTKVFARIDQPRTDKINREQFFQVLKNMETDLTQAEVNLVWSSSGFLPDKSIPFANLIRQLVMFNADEHHGTAQQSQAAQQSSQNRMTSSTTRSIASSSARAISTGRITDMSIGSQSVDYHEVYDRILPHVRQNYNRIKVELIENDSNATGLVDFTIFLNILQQHSVPVSESELGSLVRLDNPHNGSKVQYPFFIRKYHPEGPVIRTSPWLRVHPVYENLIQKQHAKHPVKEVYDQRIQNPRDLKYFIRLFTMYDKSRKGYLTNDEFYSLLRDNGINLNKLDEDYYQLFSKYDKQLRDQFNYTDLFRTMIITIMS